MSNAIMSMINGLLRKWLGMRDKTVAVAFATSLAGFAQIASAATLDLTGATNSGVINGGYFFTPEETNDPTGSGVFDSFLRLQETGNGDGVQEGFNTDAKQILDNVGGNFTRSLLKSEIPIRNGFFAFALDLNETANTSLIDIEELRLFGGPGLNDATTLSGLTPIWDLDNPAGDTDNRIALDYNKVGKGSGRADMLFYVSASLFDSIAPDEFIVLYSKFSSSDAGFEEWATLDSATAPAPAPVPLPAAAWLLISALGGLGLMARRRSAA